MLKVLVAEDSTTARELLVQILRADGGIDVIGEAKNGLEAVAMTLSLRPDVVTMDITMPLMDGFEATRQIMIEAPTPIVLVSASSNVREVQFSMHALRAGALAVMQKPPGPESPDFEEQARQLVGNVKAMAAVKVVRRFANRLQPEPLPPPLPPSPAGARPRVVAVGASTGGPAAIARILADLPGDFGLPLLAVQHIASGFSGGLAEWLNTVGALRVKVAEDGEALEPRRLYLAPDDRHLGLRDANTVALSEAASIGGFRPSATYLFESVARVFGSSTLALILTGMGRDGVDGLRAIRAAGGRVIAQDEQSSVVFGMPGAALAAGFADVALPLGAIATRLKELA